MLSCHLWLALPFPLSDKGTNKVLRIMVVWVFTQWGTITGGSRQGDTNLLVHCWNLLSFIFENFYVLWKRTILTWYFIRFSYQALFAKLQTAAISFVMSVRPYVCMEQLGPHQTEFHEIWYLSFFRKSVAKIQISLKSEKNNWYFTWRPRYIYEISMNSSLEWDTHFRQKL
jgi:hypothetical protein